MFEDLKQFLRDNPRFPLVAAAAVLAGGLVVWLAWGGVDVQVGQFFAAEPSACPFSNKDAPECACAQNRANGTACHVCTRSFQEGNTDYSDAQWFAWDNLNLCRPSCPASFPYETERTKQDGSRFPLPQGCVEKPPDCPDGFHALGDAVCEPNAPAPTATVQVTQPPTPGACTTPSPGTHTASVLAVQCGATRNILTWTLPPGNDTNAILKNVDGADGFSITPGPACNAVTFTDTDVQTGRTYTYRHKAFADRTSNSVTCAPGQTASPSPTATATATVTVSPSPTASVMPTPTPIPTATAEPSTFPTATSAPGLSCAPQAQTIFLGQIAFFQASGGNGVYSWNGGPSAIQEDSDGFPGSAAFGYTVIGRKVVTVTSAGQRATCVVEVVPFNPSATPVPGPTGPVAITKQARVVSLGQTAGRDAVTVRDGFIVEFIVRILDREGDGTGALTVEDTLPPGMSYAEGSATVDGDAVGNPTFQLPLDALEPGGQRTLRWQARAARVGELPAGATEFLATAAVTASEDGEQFTRSADVALTIFGTGTALGGSPLGGAGEPATGPGGATMLALAVAACTSLLYAAYTRSPRFRKHEISIIRDDQGPMDFRS